MLYLDKRQRLLDSYISQFGRRYRNTIYSDFITIPQVLGSITGIWFFLKKKTTRMIQDKVSFLPFEKWWKEFTMFHIKKKARPKSVMRPTSLFGKVAMFHWVPESQCPQRMEPEMSFRTDYSPIAEKFLTNRDDQRITSSQGMMFPPLNAEGNKLTINWGTLERWLKHGVQAWTLKHIPNWDSRIKTPHEKLHMC